MGTNPHANGGCFCGSCACRISETMRCRCLNPGSAIRRANPHHGATAARCDEAQWQHGISAWSAPMKPPRTVSPPCLRRPTRLMAERVPDDDHLAPDGRVMEILTEHTCQVARRLSPHRTPRALLVLRSIHSHRGLDVQPARQVAEGQQGDPVATPDRLPQHPSHLARLATGPQRLLPPGPGIHRPGDEQEGSHRAGVSRPRIPTRCSA